MLIREMRTEEYYLLEEFLYEAIFQRNQEDLLPKNIIYQPELFIYIKDFGSLKDDYCLCAEHNGKIVAAVWVRIISGFDQINKDTPEFAISVLKDYRGLGLGRKLMAEMLQLLKEKDYKNTSLAVQKDNYALKMYQSLGFQIIDENDEEYLMIFHLNK
ncbi:GNAT family N-acetyltransferase [Enterococcus alishanensis]|uniref:GNAT family N-acetyltransferase n=1 Tax=Enterococcus alishanensis TaxID=1303817 RepID=A0ABS6TCY8_9ENTE|nr:GNAT family N-acetyltransferase [Enterococcus alishanensis]MBV7390763.1 GNAT family N-acetyltransferase [Enterococcus alishanensis]